MPWARFEDRYPANRKVRPLSDAAFRLDVTAICWSAEQLTDGHVEDLDDLIGVKNAAKAAAELVRRGRWHTPGHTCDSAKCRPIQSGWLIHDYFDYNPQRTQVITDRAAAAERQRRAREAAKAKRNSHGGSHGGSHANSNGSGHDVTAPVSHASSDTVSHGPPGPARPEHPTDVQLPRRRARPRSTTDERVEQAINAGRDVQAWVDAGGLRAIEGGAS